MSGIGSDNNPILSVRGLQKHFQLGGTVGRKNKTVRAVDGIDFDIHHKEIIGLVGESGSGKTTVGRMIVKLIEPTNGKITFDGNEISKLTGTQFKPYRKHMQIVFQDPFASLNPRMRIRDILEEGLKIHRIGNSGDRMERIIDILELVGLSPDILRRYPHEFSGGQRQRIGIARALAVNPKFLVADEPVSALDVSIQAQVINLLDDLQQKMGLTVLFISHDLGVVEYICDRVMVMYLGHIVENGPTESLFSKPRHPYTEALLSAIPNPDPDVKGNKIVLKGDIPSPTNPPSGCVFRTRCPYAIEECSQTNPLPRTVGPAHTVSCIRTDIL